MTDTYLLNKNMSYENMEVVACLDIYIIESSKCTLPPIDISALNMAAADVPITSVLVTGMLAIGVLAENIPVVAAFLSNRSLTVFAFVLVKIII